LLVALNCGKAEPFGAIFHGTTPAEAYIKHFRFGHPGAKIVPAGAAAAAAGVEQHRIEPQRLQLVLPPGTPLAAHQVGGVEGLEHQPLGAGRPGAAALDLAYVAAGRVDGFWEIGLSAWDTAAGTLLITEAGGRIGTLTGQPYTQGGHVVAGTPKVSMETFLPRNTRANSTKSLVLPPVQEPT
jgi:hypothetical protein